VGKLSIAYDADTGKDNIWPLGLSVTFEDTWGILFLDKAPMDTTIVTSSTTTEIPEFPTAMIGMVTALGLSLCILRRSMRKSH